MMFAGLTEIKEQLAFAADLGAVDDALLTRILGAAEGYVSRRLGFALDANSPDAIKQAVLMLAAHWYENREATITESLKSIPFGVDEILREYRNWEF